MDYRFNSYYYETMHPFIQAMADFLKESGDRARRPAITQMFHRQAQQKYDEDIELLRRTSDEVIKARREHPTKRKDLWEPASMDSFSWLLLTSASLNAMLNGTDPKTGEKMSDDSVTDNMITFLIAGHETTSGLLSFVFYYLLKNPAAYQKAQQEVDNVIGKGPITVEQLSKIPYINAVCLVFTPPLSSAYTYRFWEKRFGSPLRLLLLLFKRMRIPSLAANTRFRRQEYSR